MTAKQRSRILMKFADLMEAHADELAALESLDNGGWGCCGRGGRAGLGCCWAGRASGIVLGGWWGCVCGGCMCL